MTRLTRQDKNAIRNIVRDEIEKTKPDPEIVDNPDDLIEDVADESLLYIAGLRYSKWIVAFLVGLIYSFGWFSNQYYFQFRDWILHTFLW